MNNLKFLIFLFLLMPSTLSAGLFGNPARSRIEKLLRSPVLASANVGVKAVDLGSGKTVIDHNGGKLFIPASTVKILTAYTALKVLSPQYTFMTEFSTDIRGDSETVHDLWIKGYGDPSMSLADINLQAMTVAGGNIKRVTGDVIVDNSFFDPVLFGHGWMWDEGIVAWNAPISPAAVNGNCVDIYVSPGPARGSKPLVRIIPETRYAVAITSAVTGNLDDARIIREEAPSGDRFIVIGSVNAAWPAKKWKCAVSRPGLYAGTLFKDLLLRYGVKVAGKVYEGTVSTAAVCIDRFNSRPLGDIVRFFVKESDNLTGECLLKALGASVSTPGDAEKGIGVVQNTLGAIGIKPASYTLADGSGLSTYNLLSPDVLTTILRAAHGDLSIFPEFSSALSIAGVDGTLKERMKGTALAAFVRGKTGTMSGVSCISGYLQTRKGTLLAVTIMINGFTGPAQPMQAAQDEILRILWDAY
jgi:D-alanyl-D-alanine carboxypeptidase/D-alanyl-D-alanine-endopeptidase (penicillin-binding protein 4)